jgi:hypothetical protein
VPLRTPSRLRYARVLISIRFPARAISHPSLLPVVFVIDIMLIDRDTYIVAAAELVVSPVPTTREAPPPPGRRSCCTSNRSPPNARRYFAVSRPDAGAVDDAENGPLVG